MSNPIVFLDTETTGVHDDRQVWEVAMIRRDGATERVTSFMMDVDLAAANVHGLNVGRFYERHPVGRYLSGASSAFPAASGIGRRDAALEVARCTHGATIVGIVPNFDTEVLARLLVDAKLVPTWHYHLKDVSTMAAGYLSALRRMGRWPLDALNPDSGAAIVSMKSEELSVALGVLPPGDGDRHTALGDARWAMRQYDAMTNEGTAP